MGDLIKVSATVLPRFIEGDNLVVDVALNPYLTVSKESLSYYYEIINWTKYFNVFYQKINFKFSAFDTDWKPVPNADIPASLEGSRIDFSDIFCEDIPSKEKNTEAAELLWGTMFTNETFVSQWNLDELPYNIVAKISSRELNNEVVQALDEFIEDLVANNNSQDNLSLALHLTNLKKSTDPALLILNDPIVSGVAANGKLRGLFRKLMSYINEYHNQLNDMYRDLSLHEQESRNVDNTAEFHKKFSGYSNHTFLLRKTGWIWRYAIDISTIKNFLLENAVVAKCTDTDYSATKIFVSIDPEDKKNYRAPLYKLKNNGSVDPIFDSFHLSFLEEVKFLYPLTSIQFYKQDDSNLNKNVYVGTKTPQDKETFLKLDPRTGYIKIKNGNEKHLHASIIDRKQLMDKLEQQYKTIKANAAVGPSTVQQDVQNRDLSADIENERAFSKNLAENGGSSEYTNNGITIALENYNRVIQTTVANTPAVPMHDLQTNPEGLEGTGMLFMHNVMAGLRIDAAAFNSICQGSDHPNFFFGSLCEKEEYFYIQNKDESFCIKFPDCANKKKYEGYLGASGQASNSGTLYIDQEITRWNNWSVVCMRLGDNRTYINEPPPDGSSILNIAVMPPEASMVPQRFGWKYMFALRPTDICGEGPIPIDQQEQLLRDEIAGKLSAKKSNNKDLGCIVENCWSDPILYQRVDAVSSPRIIFGTQIFVSHQLKKEKRHKKKDTDGINSSIDEVPDWLSARWGEDLKTMVIRSHVENGQLKMNPNANSTMRFIGPPNANIDFVMQHGALDNLLLDINPRKVTADNSKLDKLREQLFSLANKKAEDEDMLQLIPENSRVDYLYDPLADGIELELENEFHSIYKQWGMFLSNESPGIPGSSFAYIKDCYWKENGDSTKNLNQFITIQLKERLKETSIRDGKYYIIDRTTGIAEVQQGFEVNLRLRCFTQWKPNNCNIDLFYPGVAKARSTQMKMVHAVQKPCLLYNFYYDSTNFLERIERATLSMKRFPNKTVAFINLNFERFPILTSESFHLHIQYIDLIGDKTKSFGYRIEQVHKIIKSNLLPVDTTSELNVLFANIEHPFDDTKHKHANYRLEAVSKFKKYFDPKIFSGDDPFSVYGILRKDFVSESELNSINDCSCLDEYNQFVSKNKWQIIPNTKQPQKPIIEKIVPLTEWVVNEHVIERRCNKVRMYLEDWHSTGVNEKLAIFFLKPNANDELKFSSKNVINIQNDKDQSLSTVISQFGLDPASGDDNLLNIIDEGFLKGVPIIDNIPLSDLEFAKPDFQQDLSYFDNIKVNAAIYEVQFINADSINANLAEQYGVKNFEPVSEGKYFVDVEINNECIVDHYFPFLRFAVARYQESSIQFKRQSDNNNSFYYQFSPVILSDFIQLLPYRMLTISDTSLTYHMGKSVRKGENMSNVLLLFGEDETNKVYDHYDTASAVYDIAKFDLADNKVKSTSENIRQYILQNESIEILNFKNDRTHLNIFEYENYNSVNPNEIHEYSSKLTDDPEDLRNDHKKRLIFSYSLKL